MKEINKDLLFNFKKVSPERYKLTKIIEGHKIELILTNSEARQIIGIIDNEL